jgi:hypothetical protein
MFSDVCPRSKDLETHLANFDDETESVGNYGDIRREM